MASGEHLERRLRAVERALDGDEHDGTALDGESDLAERVEELETDLDAATERIAELEATTQALRGYVGNVRSVNEDVEQRAEAAVAAVDRLEERFDAADGERASRRGATTPQSEDSARRDRGPTRVASTPRSGTDDRGGTCESESTDEDDGGDNGLLDRVRERL